MEPSTAGISARVVTAIDHALVLQELGALEAGRQLLADGLLDHAGPAKPIRAPGSARCTSPSMA
jgi:predicted cobalt transporter CbtA